MRFDMRRVSNFIWVGEEPADERQFATAEGLRRALPEISGQFAVHVKEQNGSVTLVRDPLGVNKLFFAVKEDCVESSNFLIDLIERGHPLEQVFSVPSGHSVTVRTAEKELELRKYRTLAFAPAGTPARPLDDYALLIRERMAVVFRRLSKVLAGRRLFVTLSGGLDSTTIAVAAREYLGDFTAVTFAMDDGSGTPDSSEDHHFAKLVAAELGVRMETVLGTPDAVASLLDVALVYGQDWREFNVHCALVNARIAEHLSRTHLSGVTERPVVLTGDTMNELMADYAPVTFRGKEFYSLPRLPPDKLRRFLVSGLDSGDREVGVFSYFGMDVIQPYAMLADAYASLPTAHVQDAGAKQRLVRKIMGSRIPAEIYSRPKVRAQVGGSKTVGGTLRAMADAGLTGDRLRRRFAELFNCGESVRDRLIQAGFYRSTSTFPKEVHP
jgi:asparagine synthetase B (glutamine-hydrolysing)